MGIRNGNDSVTRERDACGLGRRCVSGFGRAGDSFGMALALHSQDPRGAATPSSSNQGVLSLDLYHAGDAGRGDR